MCIVNIKVNDATMRRINPNLTDSEKIGQWLQYKVNAMLEEMVAEEEEAMALEAQGLQHDMTVEELYATIEKEVKAIYDDASL
jgi:ribosomal protein S3AE